MGWDPLLSQENIRMNTNSGSFDSSLGFVKKKKYL